MNQINKRLLMQSMMEWYSALILADSHYRKQECLSKLSDLFKEYGREVSEFEVWEWYSEELKNGKD